MVFEQQFLAGDVLRWNLGWPTPNYAGAFLAALAPYAWLVQNRKTPSILGVLTDAAVFTLLGMTFSRGALVSVVAAMAFHIIATRGASEHRLGVLLCRMTIAVLAISLTGFYKRIGSAVTLTDLAVTHRADVWRGALAMIATLPEGGWGLGQSGQMYMSFFQPVSDSEGLKPWSTAT